jgi:hypothetical protein
MTEQEWLRSPEPVRMVTHLRVRCGVTRTKAGRRKLRLFGCGCCRRVANLFPDEPGWPVVDLAERFADGNASQAEVDAALLDAEPVLQDGEGDHVRQARLNLHEAVRKLIGPAAAFSMACSSVGIALRWVGAGEASECAVQACLHRDIFGNPFRPPAIDPAWLAWNGEAAGILARTIYEGRRFEDMPVLADALEDAGCQDAAILDHGRKANDHVWGCWLLDGLMGKS